MSKLYFKFRSIEQLQRNSQIVKHLAQDHIDLQEQLLCLVDTVTIVHTHTLIPANTELLLDATVSLYTSKYSWHWF